MRLRFKSPESFLHKIAMGAVSTRFVNNLLQQQGHNPVPAEKGTLSFKVWGKEYPKMKKFRVPDLFCLKCGRGFEVRGKSKMEFSMSHSEADPTRFWDYGLKDEYYVVFVLCHKIGERPVDYACGGNALFIQVKDLREAQQQGLASLSNVKGKEEGYEKRLVWPSKLAKSEGVVEQVTDVAINVRYFSGRTSSISLLAQGIKFPPLVQKGEAFSKEQVVASVVPVASSVGCNCQVNLNYYLELLRSIHPVNRFIAAKILRFFKEHQSEVRHELEARIVKGQEHEPLVRIEAITSLVELHWPEGQQFFAQLIKGENRLEAFEAVTSLAEVSEGSAFDLLITILMNQKLDYAIRAAASWALGVIGSKSSVEVLIKTFNDLNREVKAEAARALLNISRKYGNLRSPLLRHFKEDSGPIKEGLAWVLAKLGLNVEEAIDLLTNEESRCWISYMLALQNENLLRDQMELLKRKDAEVWFAVNTLWSILKSWVWELEEY